jgi:aminomethyltransferase
VILKTPLYDIHQALGGQMVEFANTWLPVRYQSEKEEHLAVRNSVGMFDVSHMGEFIIEGNKADIFLDSILTSDIEKLKIDHAQYSLLLNEFAGIVDDLIVYRLDRDRFFLCVNANQIAKDEEHIRGYLNNTDEVLFNNASKDYAQIALQGPKAAQLLEDIIHDSLPMRFGINQINIAGIETLVARTGYTGEDGFEIFVLNKEAKNLWQLLYDRGQAYSLKPCGLAARDSLRLEAGFLLYGQDMDETVTPLEAGLLFAVAINKANFVGKEALKEQIIGGSKIKLGGFRLSEPGIARHGFIIFDEDDREIGIVTSGTLLPHQPRAIGLAYVLTEYASLQRVVFIDIRGRKVKATIEKTRFITVK